jgi:asparagine synthase (glutamine-hydrolysing)
VRRSVRSQLVSDVPVGAFLSGGVDSSAVVAFAREQSPGIRCFTIETGGIAERGQQDDLAFARSTAKALGVALDEVPVRPHHFVDSLHHLPALFDEPIADPAGLATFLIARAAREVGVKVLLSGTGADDLFAGYRRHSVLRWERIRRAIPVALRQRFGRWIGAMGRGGATSSRIAKYLDAREPSAFGLIAQLLDWSPRECVVGLIEGEQAGSLFRSIPAPLIEHLAMTESADDLKLALSLDQRFFLGDHNLVYTDRLSMASGVEVRVPLLSDELVRTSWRVPARWMIRGRESKWAFRQALAGTLPEFVLKRPKSGFGLPIRNWMGSGLGDSLAEVLFSQASCQRGVFRMDRLRDVWAQTMAGRTDGAYLILSAAFFELWCARFIDGQGLAEPSQSARTMSMNLGTLAAGWPSSSHA